ncbi:YidC/Oxa1 family membrane protein insertase [Patescibacteria group bacterium]|nr:YidC/Oxa1 family membrane protein insertase [Patescibacteria group bacterium]
MGAIFNSVIYLPILSVLKFLYLNVSFGDLGVAIFVLTVIVRLVLLPLFYKGAKDQTILQRLQPHIRKIQLDHKDDKEKQARAMMDLYKTNRVNPFSGFLLLLVQLPIFIALFEIFTTGIKSNIFTNPALFGLSLSAPSYLMAVLAALLQYFQGKMAMPAGKSMEATQKVMVVVGPLVTILVLGNLPAALSWYWTVSNLFSLGQQFYINKKLPPLPDVASTK